MSLRFSEGLLTGLRDFGKGDMPTDPNDRNFLHDAGVTNPLLQQFGKSVGGGMFGMDTRTKTERETSRTEESSKIMAEALATGDPMKMKQAAAVVGQLGDRQAAAALIAEANRIETQGKTDTRNAAADARAEQSLAIQMGQEGRSAIKFATEAEKEQAIKAASKEVAKMPNTTPGDYLKIAQFYRSKGLEEQALQAEATARELIQQTNLLGADKKAIRQKTEDAQVALGQASGAMDLANRYAQESPRGGVLGNAYSGFINFIGGDDAKVEMQAKYNSIRNTDVLQNLPPGAASDKDVEMVMKGWPSDSSNPDVIARWLRGYAKIQALVAARNAEHAKWLSQNKGDDSGFTDWVWSKEGKEAINDAVTRAGFTWAARQTLSAEDLAELNSLAQGNSGTNRSRSSRGR